MDRERRKRGGEEPVVAAMEEENEAFGGGVAAEMTRKKGKKQVISAPSPSTDVIFKVGDVVEISDVYRPPGLFEFPWQKEGDGGLFPAAAAEESDGQDLLDVFFSSLVDGCSAAIGFPGDRLSPPTGPIALPGDDEDGSCPSDGDADGDADGVDCIWSTVLCQPLITVSGKSSIA